MVAKGIAPGENLSTTGSVTIANQSTMGSVDTRGSVRMYTQALGIVAECKLFSSIILVVILIGTIDIFAVFCIIQDLKTTKHTKGAK